MELPDGWRWATRKHPGQPPSRYEENKALKAAGSDILDMVRAERDKLRRQGKSLEKKLAAAEAQASLLGEQLRAFEAASDSSQQQTALAIRGAAGDIPLSYKRIAGSSFLRSKIPEWTGFRTWELAQQY